MTKQMIIGIIHEIEDVNTGVPASFHTIGELTINRRHGFMTVSLDSYFSAKHCENGKQPLGSVSFTLRGVPAREEDPYDFAYRAIVAPIHDGDTDIYGNPVQPNDFTGAELAVK